MSTGTRGPTGRWAHKRGKGGDMRTPEEIKRLSRERQERLRRYREAPQRSAYHQDGASVPTVVVITPWHTDEQGNACRTVGSP